MFSRRAPTMNVGVTTVFWCSKVGIEYSFKLSQVLELRSRGMYFDYYIRV